jgi:hypothetical protein
MTNMKLSGLQDKQSLCDSTNLTMVWFTDIYKFQFFQTSNSNQKPSYVHFKDNLNVL